MKTIYTISMAMVMSVASFTSCSKDDDNNDNGKKREAKKEYVITDLGNGKKSIEGVINQNITLDNSTKWVLKGGVFVKSGSTLTIEEGTEYHLMKMNQQQNFYQFCKEPKFTQ